MPRPPEKEDEGAHLASLAPQDARRRHRTRRAGDRDWAVSTKRVVGREQGRGHRTRPRRLGARERRLGVKETEGGRFTIEADLILLAMEFVSPTRDLLDALGVELDGRGNVKADPTPSSGACRRTSRHKIYVCGDMWRGQSLVVWAIRKGRDAPARWTKR